MGVGHRLQPVAAAQVGVHHVGLDRAGADEGYLEHQVGEIPGLEAGDQAGLGATLHLEHAHRLPPAQHVVDRRVVGR